MISEKKRKNLIIENNKKEHCSFNPKTSSLSTLYGVEIKPKLYEKKSERVEIRPISPQKYNKN